MGILGSVKLSGAEIKFWIRLDYLKLSMVVEKSKIIQGYKFTKN